MSEYYIDSKTGLRVPIPVRQSYIPTYDDTQYNRILAAMKEYVKDQEACGYPARMQDLKEFRQWKNMPQDPEHDRRLLAEYGGDLEGEGN